VLTAITCQVRIFQCNIFRQLGSDIFNPWGYASANYSAGSDIAVQNIQSGRTVHYYTTLNRQGNSSAKYSIGRDIPLQTIQSAGIFQSKHLVSRHIYSSTQ
jgi:hypothetical protein